MNKPLPEPCASDTLICAGLDNREPWAKSMFNTYSCNLGVSSDPFMPLGSGTCAIYAIRPILTGIIL